MINGVLEKLTIIEQNPQRLVLREQPLLSWLGAFAMFIVGGALLIAGLWITTLGAWVVGIGLLSVARTRLIIFEQETAQMRVELRSLWRTQTPLVVSLREIQGATLLRDGEHTQIVLNTLGANFGLSVYSHDATDWKSDVLLAINRFVNEHRA